MKKQVYEYENGEFKVSNNITEKRVLVTHVDLDGAGCAVVALLACDLSEIYYCGNGYDIDNTVMSLINEYKSGMYSRLDIIIADNSVSESVAIELNDLTKEEPNFSVQLFDHHKSARWMDAYDWAVIDVNECGTTLLFKNYRNTLSSRYTDAAYDRIGTFCNDVKCRDLWLWEEEHNNMANIHNEYMYMLGIEKYVATIANNIRSNKYDIISENDMKLVEQAIAKKNKYVQNHINDFYTKDILAGDKTTPQNCPRYRVAYTFANQYISELGNAICKAHDDIDICAMIVPTRGEYGAVELRATKDNVDLAPLAKALGGGGHKHAAGFPLKKDFAEGIINSFAEMMSV